jgi:hypothetical protein
VIRSIADVLQDILRNAQELVRSEIRLAKEKVRLLEVWDNVRSAFIAVAATHITKYIGDRIPGFDEHYRRIAQEPRRLADLEHDEPSLFGTA